MIFHEFQGIIPLKKITLSHSYLQTSNIDVELAGDCAEVIKKTQKKIIIFAMDIHIKKIINHMSPSPNLKI